jgi:hypothetical protein
MRKYPLCSGTNYGAAERAGQDPVKSLHVEKEGKKRLIVR